MHITWTAGLAWLSIVGLARVATAQTTLPASNTIAITTGQHRNPDYAAPLTDTGRGGQPDNTSKPASGRRVGWLHWLRRKTDSRPDVYAAPVVYGSYTNPAFPSTDNRSMRSVHNQTYSIGWPGPDPLRTKWLLIRSGAGKEPDQ